MGVVSEAEAALISIEPLGQRKGYNQRILDTTLYLEACKREDDGAQWACEKLRQLTGGAEAQSVFYEGCPDNRPSLQPHEQAQ